jgi:hypothetical protein
MQNKQSNMRIWTIGRIALSVAALALLFTAAFTSTDAAAQVTGADEEADAAAADTVAVTLSDGAIQVPQRVAAGAIVFEVTNEGQAAHGFAIGSDPSAPAEVARLNGQLEAGQSETLSAELEPGTYTAYLPGQASQEHVALVSAQFIVEEQASSMR